MKTSEDYNWWLTSISDKINELKPRLPKALAQKLDSTLQSLDPLETYLMDKYTPELMTDHRNHDLLDQLASYVGNIAEREMPGSYWTINLEDKKDVDYGFPILKFKDNRPSFNPFTYITTALDRKKGNLISSAITKRKA